MSEPVEVTQADREAATEVVRFFNPHVEGAGEGVLVGQYDTCPHVQAFARHRIAAQAEEHPTPEDYANKAEADIARLRERVAELEAITKDLAATPPGGEVWDRSKWLRQFSERARAALGEVSSDA